MKLTCCLASAMLGATLAAPAPRTANPVLIMSDIDLLHYALTLENLENAVYRQGLTNYSRHAFTNDGFADPFYDDLKKLAAEEEDHVKSLGQTLNSMGTPISAECTYDFGPIEGATAFVELANIVEGLAVSAYLGIARQLTSGTLLLSTSTMQTYEARHSGYMRKALSTSPFPGSSDTPLTPNQVHTILHTYISFCPSENPTFPIKAFPALDVQPEAPGAVKAGSKIKLSTPGKILYGTKALAGAFVTPNGPVWFDVKAVSGGWEMTVPNGITGQSYLLLNSGKKDISDLSVLAGPTYLEVA